MTGGEIMKLLATALLLAVSGASAQTTCNQIGTMTFCSDGTSYNRIGNQTFGSDGSNALRVGPTTIYTPPPPVYTPPPVQYQPPSYYTPPQPRVGQRCGINQAGQYVCL